jgi:hypothetical protein
VIDLLFHSLASVKGHDILNVAFNISDDTISITNPEGTLILHNFANTYYEIDNIQHYNYINSSEGGGDLVYDAKYSQKTNIKEIDASAINLAKDLSILLKYFTHLPQNPPMRNKAVFSRKENYRKALIDNLKITHQNKTEYQFFKGAQNVDKFCKNNENTTSMGVSKVSIKVQEKACYSIDNFTDNFRNVATKLAENIFQSVNGEMNEQINKEMSRRKELRFHVELYKAYIRLQAFCSSNLSRSPGENPKTQAKTLVVRYFPHISSSNMSLMLQRAPRIYRLLLLTNEDWRLIDSFEELSSSFFKSAMKSASNFDIWINLVKTGKMVDYKEGSRMREQGKNEMKLAKLDIIKSYFDGVGDSLNEFIEDDDE